jgi:hypothetical protein
MPVRAPTAALLLLAPILLAVSGCTVTDSDVSRDPNFLVGYRPGEVYELARPVTLLRVEDGYYELLPPGEKREYGKPAGTLAAGERVMILSLRHTVSAAPIQWESGVTTEARLVNRPEWTVALNNISAVRWVNGDRGIKPGVLVPDPQWLTRVEPTPPHPENGN